MPISLQHDAIETRESYCICNIEPVAEPSEPETESLTCTIEATKENTQYQALEALNESSEVYLNAEISYSIANVLIANEPFSLFAPI